MKITIPSRRKSSFRGDRDCVFRADGDQNVASTSERTIVLTSESMIAIASESEALDIKQGSLILFGIKENQLAGKALPMRKIRAVLRLSAFSAGYRLRPLSEVNQL
ncbi:MAG: hypothetical protein JST11_30630 [Acidobacteria bacterium]|nr:hypothetical protein [Acidobacteriota bacterium]